MLCKCKLFLISGSEVFTPEPESGFAGIDSYCCWFSEVILRFLICLATNNAAIPSNQSGQSKTTMYKNSRKPFQPHESEFRIFVPADGSQEG
jgi:hypothetical protein